MTEEKPQKAEKKRLADHIWENPAWKPKQANESPTGQSK